MSWKATWPMPDTPRPQLTEIKPLIETLKQGGIRLSEAVIDRTLQLAGEDE